MIIIILIISFKNNINPSTNKVNFDYDDENKIIINRKLNDEMN